MNLLCCRCSSGHAVQNLVEFKTSGALQWLSTTGSRSLLERTGLAQAVREAKSFSSSKITNITLGGESWWLRALRPVQLVKFAVILLLCVVSFHLFTVNPSFVQGSNIMKLPGQQSATVVRTFTQQGTFCVEFACSCWTRVGFLWRLWFPPTDQKHAGQTAHRFE